MMVPTVQSLGIAVSTAMSAVFAEDPVVSVLDVDLHFVLFYSVEACYTLIPVGSCLFIGVDNLPSGCVRPISCGRRYSVWLWFCTRVLGVGDFISKREP